MSRHAERPSVDDVELALKELTESLGKPPTVLALAGRLGLANTTFRRHFPDIAEQLKKERATAPRSPEAAISRYDQLKLDNDKLRRHNHDLREHLDLAVANIQRLTLENHQLRRQLEATAKITDIKSARRPRDDHDQTGH